MTFRYPLLFILLLLCANSVFAQKEKDIWYFGNQAGIDFRGPVPVALSDGKMVQDEGSAVMCDRKTGSLLFYTNGDTLWNRNHQVMPNGTGLLGHESSTQSALIIPKPGDSNKYYIFTAGVGEYVQDGSAGKGINYTMVDMTLDGGLGAVIPSIKNIGLYAPSSEKLAAVKHCNGRGYWLVTHQIYSNAFLTFYVSRYGIGIPVLSTVGTAHTGSEGSIGAMRISSDGKKLSLVERSLNLVELFDFDNKTGIVSNARSLQFPDSSALYGLCFSPDNSKLYVSGEWSRFVCQLDLSQPTVAAIIASKTILFKSGSNFRGVDWRGAMQIGNDGKIYVANIGDLALDVIDAPNAAGLACKYTRNEMMLGDKNSDRGMPYFIDGPQDSTLETCKPPMPIFSKSDTAVCAGNAIQFADHSIDNPQQWHWDFPGGNPALFDGQTPPSIMYSAPGTYPVVLIVSNANGSDTATQQVEIWPHPALDAGPDLSFCVGQSQQIQLNATGASSYSWSPATGLNCTDCAQPVASPSITTTYTVTASSPHGCISVDSVTVTVIPYPVADAGPDIDICEGGSTTLRAGNGDRYIWSPTTGLDCPTCANPTATPTQTTTYHVTVTNKGLCSEFDSVTVRVNPPPSAVAKGGGEVCMGDSIQLNGSGGVYYRWVPKESLNCDTCANPVAAPLITTTYKLTAIAALGCISTDSVIVTVSPAPRQVKAHIDPLWKAYPGTVLRIPIILDEPLDPANISLMGFSLTYDPSILRLSNVSLDSTIIPDWQLNATTNSTAAGTYAATFLSVPPQPITGTGVIAWLTFRTFLGYPDTSKISFSIGLPSQVCTMVKTSGGEVVLDSVCGLNTRLITSTGTLYSLAQNNPNPATGTTIIRYGLGLDGTVDLSIYSATGRKVAVLVNGYLRAGAYEVTYDTQNLPSGLYYYTISSGDWTQTRSMTVVK